MKLTNKISTIMILSLLFIASNKVFPQEQFIFGLKGGINLSTLNGNESSLPYSQSIIDPSSKLGLVIGPFVTYHFSPGFAVQPELLFSMKGVNFEVQEYLQTWSLWYIELPLLFKSIFDLKDNMLGSVFVGPAFGYAIKKTWSEKFNDDYSHENVALNGINDLDLSAVIGVGADMEAMNGRLGIDFRYTYGLTSLQDNISVQNGTISIVLYYQFNQYKTSYNRW